MIRPYPGIMNQEIRHAAEADGPELLELWHGFTDYLSEYDEKYHHREGADERWLTYFENQLIDSKYGTVVVAEADDQVVGALEARVEGNHPVFRLDNHGFIHGHFVREGYRDQGIGRALMEAAESWLATAPRDVDFYRVRVMPGDEQAAALYQDAGFHAVEHIYEKTID
jgi:ribosomal protein S18 acetylase RimI-like enzyme